MENDSKERLLWKGHPSQLVALNFYLFLMLVAAALLGVAGSATVAYGAEAGHLPLYGLPFLALLALIKFLLVRMTTYELTNERILIETGILTRVTEEMELYRIRDWSVIRPFLLRLLGRGHLRLITTDSTAPEFVLEGISAPKQVREVLRRNVEAARDRKRVQQLDVDMG